MFSLHDYTLGKRHSYSRAGHVDEDEFGDFAPNKRLRHDSTAFSHHLEVVLPIVNVGAGDRYSLGKRRGIIETNVDDANRGANYNKSIFDTLFVVSSSTVDVTRALLYRL